MVFSFSRCEPSDVGYNADIFSGLADKLNTISEMHSLMVVVDGKVCFERWWEPHTPDTPHEMYSFSKSLTSTAIGFAEQEGLLRLDERLIDIFADKLPDNPSDNLKLSTIHDLLCMACGQMTEAPWYDNLEKDWLRGFFAHPFERKPGTYFCYNTLGTCVLSAVIQRKSGQKLTEYLTPRLLEPLGIEGAACSEMPDGVEMGGGGYALKTEDMARFMWFVQAQGEWEGKRLLNADWFDRATSKQIDSRSGGGFDAPDWSAGYCYQYWRCRPQGVYRADGMYGQFGIAVPHKKLLIIITEKAENTQKVLDMVYGALNLKD